MIILQMEIEKTFHNKEKALVQGGGWIKIEPSVSFIVSEDGFRVDRVTVEFVADCDDVFIIFGKF